MTYEIIFYCLISTEFNGFVSRIANLTNANLDAMRVEKIKWGQQFVEAMNVNGGDLETATVLDYVMHFFTFGWKVGVVCSIRF